MIIIGNSNNNNNAVTNPYAASSSSAAGKKAHKIMTVGIYQPCNVTASLPWHHMWEDGAPNDRLALVRYELKQEELEDEDLVVDVPLLKKSVFTEIKAEGHNSIGKSLRDLKKKRIKTYHLSHNSTRTYLIFILKIQDITESSWYLRATQHLEKHQAQLLI